jgi:hypothetical protein
LSRSGIERVTFSLYRQKNEATELGSLLCHSVTKTCQNRLNCATFDQKSVCSSPSKSFFILQPMELNGSREPERNIGSVGFSQRSQLARVSRGLLVVGGCVCGRVRERERKRESHEPKAQTRPYPPLHIVAPHRRSPSHSPSG